MSVLDFLHSNDFTEEEIEGFQKFGIGLGAYSSIMDLSVLEILRLFVSDAGSKNLQLVGGMELLSSSFLNDTDRGPTFFSKVWVSGLISQAIIKWKVSD